MRILGIFLYLRIHDNMFTGLGGLGVILAFSAGDLSRINRGAELPPNWRNTLLKHFFPDYKLPYDLKR